MIGPIASALLPAAIAAGSVADPGATAPPVDLVVESTPAGVTLRVVGRAAAPLDARYVLEVVSGPDGGSNRSTQSGTVRLRPGPEQVLLTARLGGAAGKGWRALLTVTPGVGDAYRIERRAG